MSQATNHQTNEPMRIGGPESGEAASSDAASTSGVGNALNLTLTRELHELLGAINAFAELIKAQAHGQPDVQENLDHLARAVHRAEGLISQAEVWSTKLQRRRRPLLLEPILTAVVGLLRTFARPGVRMDLAIIPGAPPVLADPLQMNQLMLHLGLRSLHALQGIDGRVNVRLEALEVSEQTASQRPGLEAGGYVRLAFQDTGQSLDTEFLQRAIAPSPAAGQDHDPIAASLAIVQNVIASHQGMLEVQSESGGGTTIQVYLPIHVTGRESLLPASIPHGNGEHILVVDDDRDQGDVTEDLLRRLGFTPGVFTDPVKALDDFRARPQVYAAAFLDLNMPGMTGVDLATQLLELRPNLPVYIVTGHHGDWTPDMARNLGIRDVLTKPLSIGTWCAALHQALHQVPIG
jgi:CheY-like chemotaxis protein